MISNEMFGGDIIRVFVNGYLKNNTDGENTIFKEKGIRTKDKLSFVFDDVKYKSESVASNFIPVRIGSGDLAGKPREITFKFSSSISRSIVIFIVIPP